MQPERVEESESKSTGLSVSVQKDSFNAHTRPIYLMHRTKFLDDFK